MWAVFDGRPSLKKALLPRLKELSNDALHHQSDVTKIERNSGNCK